MHERADLDWVEYVLRDVITFLAENEMMQSAQMLAVAAAHIEHDMKTRNAALQTTATTKTDVLAFLATSRRLR